ncbi:MAG: hypothetical protein AAF728_06035, partial [Cyanobacteria bacterium P01_D01_bin.128]
MFSLGKSIIAYHLKDGVFAEIIPPGSTAAIASGINDQGQIVGFYDNAEGIRQGYLYNKVTKQPAYLSHLASQPPPQANTIENAIAAIAWRA